MKKIIMSGVTAFSILFSHTKCTPLQHDAPKHKDSKSSETKEWLQNHDMDSIFTEFSLGVSRELPLHHVYYFLRPDESRKYIYMKAYFTKDCLLVLDTALCSRNSEGYYLVANMIHPEYPFSLLKIELKNRQGLDTTYIKSNFSNYFGDYENFDLWKKNTIHRADYHLDSFQYWVQPYLSTTERNWQPMEIK